MGLFGSRRRTTVETVNTLITQSKIVKLSYLQTLALDGNITNLDGLNLTTDPVEATVTDGKVTKSNVDKVSSAISNNIVATIVTGGLSNIYSSIARSLFGKSVSRTTTSDVKDSGWNIIRTWNQPQFDVIRYALGIKELTLAQFTYEQTSEMVSVVWSFPKEIQKVSLYVDQFIPSEFQPGISYIQYFIKPEGTDTNWIRINPIGLPTVFNSDGTIVPRIISFNTEQPINSRLEESYITTTIPVKAMRFRAVFFRPDTIETNTDVSANAYTPILRSYKLLAVPRGGL